MPRADLVAALPDLLGGFGATQQQIDCATAYVEANLPEVIAIGVGPAKGTDYVIADRMNPKNKANGAGVDHLDDVLGNLLDACGIG